MAGAIATLSVLNWFHLTATVLWFGGVLLNIFILSPAARDSLEPPIAGRFMGSYMKRFRVMVYFCLGVLVVTGAIMMVFSPQFTGAMNFNTLWTQMVLVKHILTIILIVIGIYMMEFILPKMGRLAAQGPSPEAGKLQKLQIKMAVAAAITAILILIFTSISQAISTLA
jgi:uncharacterized membrane protein